MTGTKSALQPANWQVTTATVYCEQVSRFVTLVVRKDWTAKCAGAGRQVQGIDNAMKELMKNCKDPKCSLIAEYQEKLIREE